MAAHIGKKTPATHWVKPAASPAVDDERLLSWILPVITAPAKKAKAGSGKNR